MSQELHAKILGFLAAEFARKDHRQCVRLSLTHAQVGFRGEELRTWDKQDDPDLFASMTKIEGLASEIIRIAEDEAEQFSLHGTQRFVLRTEQYLGGRAKCTFVIAPSMDSADPEDTAALAVLGGQGDAGAGGKSATVANVLAMQMRHNEKLMTINAQTFRGSLDAALRQNQMLVEENIKLREERATMMKEIEESRSQKDERELRALAQVASDNRKDKAVGKLLQLAPVVAAKIAGKDNVPGAPTGLAILVSELGKSLAPQQIQRIAGALTMEQKILFAEAMKIAKESTPADETPNATPAGTSENPEPAAAAEKGNAS